jgi:glycosyltransferase involved in cell wall biosynthesis
MKPTVRILGTHGVPAAYGGFETAAEQIGLFLVDRGWRVVVYCQTEGRGEPTYDTWRGIERVSIPQHREGWRGTSAFDLTSIRHAVRADRGDVCLTFGYNTGVFNILQRVKGIPNLVNMDGMEWTRARWGPAKQALLLANERLASLFANHLVADHPQIARYLRRWTRSNRVTTITYGAHALTDAPVEPLRALGLEPGQFVSVICRPIRENSLVEIVEAFSRRRRGVRLVVLGNFTPDTDEYHREVMAAASPEVLFPGAIYDPAVVSSLRYHSRAYLHGHTVGGTNPSLVEALAAGNPVIAHDNVYNRWVATDRQRYFTGVDDLAAVLDDLLDDSVALTEMSTNARRRHAEEFTWEHVAGQYEDALLALLSRRRRATGEAAPHSEPRQPVHASQAADDFEAAKTMDASSNAVTGSTARTTSEGMA